MNYQVSATKYRPQSFDELIGQEFVAATLKNSIQSQRIANAYLLSGPRGVGKTSTARIIAKAINCDTGPTENPCNTCDNCVTITGGYNNNVIEIDGASNTSINDVRVIQEEIIYPPVNAKYKIYIIDEVHMLSKSAFNALLKTIEEPPPHIVFIFATTEINKVPATIRSRCQQFNFRLIPPDLIYSSLEKILRSSEVSFDENALQWVAGEGKGSMRDAYTLLDQVIAFSGNEITLEKIQKKLGIVGEDKISFLVKGIARKDRELIFSEYMSVLERGVSPEQVLKEIITFFRNLLFKQSNLTATKFIGYNPSIYENEDLDLFTVEDVENILEVLFNTYGNIRHSVDLQTEIEICLLKLIQYNDLIRPKQIIQQLRLLQKKLAKAPVSQAGFSAPQQPVGVEKKK